MIAHFRAVAQYTRNAPTETGVPYSVDALLRVLGSYPGITVYDWEDDYVIVGSDRFASYAKTVEQMSADVHSQFPTFPRWTLIPSVVTRESDGKVFALDLPIRMTGMAPPAGRKAIRRPDRPRTKGPR